MKGSWDRTPRCGKPSCSLTSSSSFNPTIPGSFLQRPFPPSVVHLEEIARFSSQGTAGVLSTQGSLPYPCSGSAAQAPFFQIHWLSSSPFSTTSTISFRGLGSLQVQMLKDFRRAKTISSPSFVGRRNRCWAFPVFRKERAVKCRSMRKGRGQRAESPQNHLLARSPPPSTSPGSHALLPPPVKALTLAQPLAPGGTKCLSLRTR